jgi:hypothetical protein
MKTIRYVSIFLLGQLMSFSSVAAAELSAAQKREIIFDCTQLVNDYAYYRDLHDPVGFANIFSEDARLQARGVWLEGDEIAQHVLNDDPAEVSMHLMTTIKIMPIDESSAIGVSYGAVAHEPKGQDGAAAVLSSFVVIGQYHDKFKMTDEGWKISERAFDVIFRKPEAE